jgi:transposase
MDKTAARPNSVRTEVNKRIKVLNLANKLESVSMACKIMRVSRTQFYEYKRRYEKSGIDGLKPVNNGVGSRKQRISGELLKLIVEISIEQPSLSSKPIETILKKYGFKLSSISIQKVLRRNKLSTRFDRWMHLEKRLLNENFELNKDQQNFLLRMNPCQKERNMIGCYPGQLLVQDYFVGIVLENDRKVHCHFVMDTFSNLVFLELKLSKEAEHAVNLLKDSVIPFFKKKGLKIENIITNKGRSFNGDHFHHFHNFLGSQEISHLAIKSVGNGSNGFADRFIEDIKKEFFLPLKTTKRESMLLADLNNSLADWLSNYNRKRKHCGYPNFGTPPMDVFKKWMNEKEGQEIFVEA